MVLTSFPQFPQLPTEIRRLIWRQTWEPRAVVVCISFGVLGFAMHNALPNPNLVALPQPWPMTVTTTTKLPTSFYVNYESRHETLLYYKLLCHQPPLQSRVYFNYTLDILALPAMGFELSVWRWVRHPDLAQLKEVIIRSRTSPWPSLYTVGGEQRDHRNFSLDNTQHVRMLVPVIGRSVSDYLGGHERTTMSHIMDVCPNLTRFYIRFFSSQYSACYRDGEWIIGYVEPLEF